MQMNLKPEKVINCEKIKNINKQKKNKKEYEVTKGYM